MWVARDTDGGLSLFLEEPDRKRAGQDEGYAIDCWDSDEDFLPIDAELFPTLKWEDEPIEVSIVDKSELEILKKKAETWDSQYVENEH